MLGLSIMREEKWRVGDGREQSGLDHVRKHATKGDPQSVLAAIDSFAVDSSFLMNVGDVNGKILDDAVKEKKPKLAMVLGSYNGYSTVKIAMNMSSGSRLFAIEVFKNNAKIVI